MKIVAVGRFQLVHDGHRHTASDGGFDAPDELATQWIANGLAVEFVPPVLEPPKKTGAPARTRKGGTT
jgi:hypothetical protein